MTSIDDRTFSTLTPYETFNANSPHPHTMRPMKLSRRFTLNFQTKRQQNSRRRTNLTQISIRARPQSTLTRGIPEICLVDAKVFRTDQTNAFPIRITKRTSYLPPELLSYMASPLNNKPASISSNQLRNKQIRRCTNERQRISHLLLQYR